MKIKWIWCLALGLMLLGGLANAETRTYRQVKDVVVEETGRVSQSDKKENLFEYTYNVDRAKKIVTRTAIRRLDKPTAEKDATVYKITQEPELWGSAAGNGGEVLIAVRKDGGEILELGHRFAFTMRTSPFSQVITGIYRRAYDKEHRFFRHRHDQHRPK